MVDLGSAWVSISPAGLDTFGAKAKAGIAAAMRGVKTDVPVGVDINAATASLQALKQKMAQLGLADFADMNVPVGKLSAQMRLLKRLLNQSGVSDVLDMNLDPSKLKAQLGELGKLTETIRVNFDVAKVPLPPELQALLEQVQVTVDTKPALSGIAALRAKMAELQKSLTDITVNADDTSALAKLAALQVRVNKLTATTDNLKVDADTLPAMAKLLALQAAVEKVGASATTTEASGLTGWLLGLSSAAGTAGRGMGGFWGVLALGTVPLFAGAAAISGLHLALDATVETLAIAIPAAATMALGLGAFALVATQAGDTAGKVADHLRAVYTVSQATGQAIPPMTNAFDKLTTAIRPQVWQLYGDAINAASGQMGLIGKLALSTGGVLDTIAARIVVDMSGSGSALNKFISAGQRDLSALGGVLLTLGNAFSKLIQVAQHTGIAEMLLGVVGVAAKVLDLFTKLPIPLLEIVFYLHGAYIWIGLMATGAGNLLAAMTRWGVAIAGFATKIGAIGGALANTAGAAGTLGDRLATAAGGGGGLAKALGFIGDNPWVAAIAVGVIAVTALAIWLSKAKDATDQFVTASQKAVQNASIYTVINTTAQQLYATNQKLADATSHLSNVQSSSFLAIAGGVHDVQALTSNHALLTQQLKSEVTHLSDVSGAFGVDLPRAMALAVFAGVKVSDLTTTQNRVWDTALQKIRGVITGYQNMGQGLDQIGNDVSAVSYAASDQLKAIANLNSAWDAFTKNLSAPIDTFISFANSIIKFGSDSQVAGAQMSGLGTGVQAMSKKVTDASLQLQSDFQSSFQAANQLFDAMRTSQAPADQQVKAIKDAVAVLIPLAGTSKAAAAEISALAQEAGGPATTNLQTLQKWAGVTASKGMTGLQNDTNNAAVAMSNLSLDAQNLANALSQDLTADMSKAIQSAVGIQGAMDNFTQSLKNNGATAALTKKDRTTLYNDLIAIGQSSNQANSIIAALSGGIKTNANTSDNTQKSRQAVIDAFNNQRNAATNAKNDLSNYTDQINKNGADSDTAQAARQRLIKDLISAGVNSNTANGDVNTYTNAVSKNGSTSDQARAARLRLIQDILNTSNNANTGNTDLSNYTSKVQDNGYKSDAAKGARAKLIQDLENAGLNAQTATGLVNGLTNAVGKIPSSKTVGVYVQGQGAWTITQGSLQQKLTAGTAFGAAAGGVLPGYMPGRDTVPALLSPGEGVLVPEAVKAIGPGTIHAINHRYGSGRLPARGAAGALGSSGHFAGGGIATSSYGGGFGALGPWVDARYGDSVAAGVNAITAAMTTAINKAIAAASFGTGTAGDIVSYAASFLGKIPYVFGGTNMVTGADCSGFTGNVLRHFGWNPPRTSEEQGGWVTKVPTPQSGGLAFYNSPGGGPPPGHVAIIRNAATTISQGGPGRGPTIGSTGGALFYGVPPGGFASATANAVSGGGNLQQIAKALLQQHGWLVQWPAFNSLENAEAGWNMNARNPSSGAYGLAQFINGPGEYAQYGGNSTTGVGQLTAMMNYIAQRYGDPNGAWAHELGYHWYSGGGLVADSGRVTLRPGYNSVYNGTGKSEPMQATSSSGSGGLSADARAIVAELRALRKIGMAAPAGYAQALNSVTRSSAGIGYYGG